MAREIKILIVDDEEDYSAPMELWLTTKGYAVKVANGGFAALDAIKENKPDVVLLDLVMPEMDGIETLKRIREIDKDLSVIIVSAFVDPEKIAQAKPYSVAGVFFKGQRFDSLLSLLAGISF